MNRRIKRTCVLVCCFLLPGIRAEASSRDVILTTEGNKVDVTVSAMEEDVLSMQLALDVKLTEGNADTKISFEFAPEIAGSVKQYRYDRDTGTLSVYISGSQDQRLPRDQELGLGKVVVDAGNGNASATVDVRQGSLQIVNDAYDLYRFTEINASPTQKVTAGDVSTDVPAPGPGENENPAEPSDPAEPPDSSADSSSGSSEGSSSGTSSGSSSSGGASFAPAEGGTAVPPDRVRPGRNIKVRPAGSRTESEQASEAEEEELKEEDLPNETAANDPAEEPVSGEEILSEESARDSGKISPKEDGIFLGALAAAVIAAGVVASLMVLEYKRKKALTRGAGKSKKSGRKKK